MKIDEFLGKRKVIITELAHSIGYSRNHISSVFLGKVRAGRKLARILETATEGRITEKDLQDAYDEFHSQKILLLKNETKE